MELEKLVEQVYTEISAIPVSGDYVEVMASARETLRTIFKSIKEEKERGNGR